jgi:hypothetical protein
LKTIPGPAGIAKVAGMITETTIIEATRASSASSSAYSVWFGKPVVLLVVIRNTQVPVPCSIIGESLAEVRVRIDPGWEMGVRKDLILAVEEDALASAGRVH